MAAGSSSAMNHETWADETYEHPSPPTSTLHSLSRAVYERRAEYTRPHNIKIKVGSWNVAACKDVEKDIGAWFVEGKGVDTKLAGFDFSDGTGEDREERRTKKQSISPAYDRGVIIGRDKIDLYVLGLQEVVELSSAKEYLTRVYVDPSTLMKWKAAITAALPAGYQLVSENQQSGLLLLIYASPALLPTIGSVSSVSIGTGLLGYLGNKGAVITRIVLGETARLVFVNCHLASGTGLANLERRCWDVTQILTRTHFEPISHGGVLGDKSEGIGEEDFAFWFGDLNFRLEGLPGEDIRRLLTLHTRGEYGNVSKPQGNIDQELEEGEEPVVVHHVDSDESTTSSSPMDTTHSTATKSDDSFWSSLPDPDDFIEDSHSDPTSLQATINSLLSHDELRYAQKKRLAFHDGWREGPIMFLPSYKYDIGSVGVFDSSEKMRAPSWCDRILYRTRCNKLEYDRKLQEEELARLKDEELKSRGIDHAGDDDEILFDYDPDSDGADLDANAEYGESKNMDADSQTLITGERHLDSLHLDIYTSHQRVLSSDHKPLVAVFAVQYDAVVPELKAEVQHEVARELDRVENEGRPGITVVVDNSQESDALIQRSAARNVSSTDGTSIMEGVEGVEFKEVRYLTRTSRNLTVANTSRVPATFSFVKRPAFSGGDDSICPEWLKVTIAASSDGDEADQEAENIISDVTVVPGDAINVMLEIYVDKIEHVQALNRGTMQLDDVLVLRVLDGRDHFIPVRGIWLQSCLGRSIYELIRVPKGGVRALRPHHASEIAPINEGQDICWSAPRELFKLTEAVEILTERAVAEKDMIESASFPMDSIGWPFEQSSWLMRDRKVREQRRSCLLEALDNDKNLVESLPLDAKAMEKLETVAEVLLLFLGSLEDGIITAHLWGKLEQDTVARKQPRGAEEERTLILDVLSSAPHHNISFVFLTSMLSKTLGELAPVPRPDFAHGSGSAKSSNMDHRRSLSSKGRGIPLNSQDPLVSRHKALARRWSELFAGVIFRISPILRERDRKAAEDRKRQLVEVFLQGDIEQY